MAPGGDGSAEPGFDPMRQFAELAGDMRDPYPMLAEIRADSPVMQVNLASRTGRYRQDEKAPRIPLLFTVFSHEHARQVLTDSARFSSAGYAMTMGRVMGRTILQMDPPEHQRHRALVASAFRAQALHRWAGPVIGATVTELIDGFAGDGHADLIGRLTFPFPIQVIARILGLPRADWPRFSRLSGELIAVMGNWERAVAAGTELRAYFAEIIADRRRNTGADLVSELVRAEVDGHRLSDEEIYPFLLLLLPAGAETTYRSSGNLLFGLLTHPGQLDAVRADRSLVPRAIEEALRWETPLLTIARMAVREVELGGVRIPRNALVAVSLGAANRDSGRYRDPGGFDIFRDARPHMSFGRGPHLCLGMHLARLEMRVLLNAVLDRLPRLRLDPDAHDPHIHGLIFRSPPELPVRFDPPAAQAASRTPRDLRPRPAVTYSVPQVRDDVPAGKAHRSADGRSGRQARLVRGAAGPSGPRGYCDLPVSADARGARVGGAGRGGETGRAAPADSGDAHPAPWPGVADFDDLVRRYRRELHVHCYRMLGSFDEAEDHVQEVLLRAWRSRERFAGRSSARTWLYRVATNACLDTLRRDARRAVHAQSSRRAGPALAGPALAGTGPSITAMPWVQPYPDALLDEMAADQPDPETVAVSRETMSLAFLATIQLLPPRQRAVLILRDVLSWPAAGVAELLDTSVPAVNSALQRARTTLRDQWPGGRLDWAPAAEPDSEQRRLLQRFIAAHEQGDPEALIAVLRHDVRLAISPQVGEWNGRQEVDDALRDGMNALGRWRLVPITANGQPGAAGYLRRPGQTAFFPFVLTVLRFEHGRLIDIAAFEQPSMFAAFGLPASL